MKKIVISIYLVTSAITAYSWGQTGHRVVGLIAENHLTPEAKEAIDKVLQNETLAEVSTFMDFIRADGSYGHMAPWHYSTIPDGMNYEEVGTPEKGDVISTIRRLMAELKTGNFTDEDEAFALKCLVHLVGDIHQPLHVGNGEDRGGNDVSVNFFGEEQNLHWAWDASIIDRQQYSYTEYTNWINHPSQEEIILWQSSTVLDWAYESMKYREQAYDFDKSEELGYRYIYKNLDLVNLRLLQAGVRLAGVLNAIYG